MTKISESSNLNMPYNTRRKSLSLPALGIQLPLSSRAHRPSLSKSSNSSDVTSPPAKRVKTIHKSPIEPTSSPLLTGRPRSSTTSSSTSKTVTFADRPTPSGRAILQHTPPPSPGNEGERKIDFSNINDEIVTGVIEQLQKTGNQPHLVKELATVLATTCEAVASSANPAALLSSRLATYMRRPTWSNQTPCPVGKDLILIHPRKVYYFLTTQAQQPLPLSFTTPLAPVTFDHLTASDTPTLTPSGPHKTLAMPLGSRIISPSLSDASLGPSTSSSTDDDADARARAALSPSPEVDLDLDLDLDLDNDIISHGSSLTTNHFSVARNVAHDPPPPPPATPTVRSFATHRASITHLRSARPGAHIHGRGNSPPLEGDEREFTDTACAMRARGIGFLPPELRTVCPPENSNSSNSSISSNKNIMVTNSINSTHELNCTAPAMGTASSAALFGVEVEEVRDAAYALSSPMGKVCVGLMRPEVILVRGVDDWEREYGWGTGGPEAVELSELDDLFGAF